MQWSNLDSANCSFLRRAASAKLFPVALHNMLRLYLFLLLITIDKFVNLALSLDDIEAHSTNLVLMWASE